MHFKLSIVFCLMLTFYACQQDDSDVTEVIGEETETTVYYHDSHLIGMVTDEAGSPVVATIEVEGKKELSSQQGVFLFPHARVNAAGSWLVARAKGHWPRWNHMLTTAGSVTSSSLVLESLADPRVFMSELGHEMQLEDMVVSIPPHSFMQKNGMSYHGPVHFYIRKVDEAYGRPGAVNQAGRVGLLKDEYYFEFVATNDAGEELNLSKGIHLHLPDNGKDMMQMNTHRGEWKSLPRVEGAYEIESLQPIALGQWTEGFQQTFELFTETGQVLGQLKYYMVTGGGRKYPLILNQDGRGRLAAGKSERLRFLIEDKCGATVYLGGELPLTGGSETLKTKVGTHGLKQISSEVKVCEGSLQAEDWVILLASGENGPNVILHEKNTMTWMTAACDLVSQATYYRGSEKLYSIQLTGATDALEQIRLVSPVNCVNKVSASLEVDGVSVLLDKEEYIAYNEIDGSKKNLVISDLSGFTIILPNDGMLGNFVPLAMLFNHPSITDCEDGTCLGVSAKVKEMGDVGTQVWVQIEGVIDGKNIKGEFKTLLAK